MAQHFWEERFAQEAYVYGTEPNAFLVENMNYFFPGKSVLAVADGEGRNGAWLAKNGLQVTSVDAAFRGLQKAEKLAREYKCEITTVHADLEFWQWPVAAFDYVVSVFVQFPEKLRPLMHQKMMAALKPEGIILLQAFSKEQLHLNSGGPKNPSMLYSIDQLESDFSGMEILTLEHTETELDEGHFHQGRASVVNYIGRKA
jgi:2-polyprenyl-3-methyl-5-hydroxy-6-metoxy-1,4-benzoquinol methylase